MAEVLKKSALGLTVTLFFFVALEAVLFVAGVTPVSDRTDPYVGFSGYAPLFVESTTHDGQRVFRTADAKFDWFNPQSFPVRKADGVQRVFCVGGSTTYGRPYDDATSFCGWLRAFLPAADPSRRWEVVNAGGISYASYRIVRLMEELDDHEPDLFIVYTGHNEFLERRTYDRLLRTPALIRDLGSLASKLRTYSLLSDVLYPTADVLDSEIDNILDESIGPEDYHRDDVMRDAVVEHFRVSLERMTRIAAGSGAELVFVTPASNVRDFSPFKSEPSAGLDETDVREVERLEASIREHLERREYERAATLADDALALDPRNADLLFLRGRALLALDRIADAERALTAALDEDVAPLRAPSRLVRTVGDVAAATSTPLVDFVAITEAASSDGIPGDEQFLDHVHPSIESNRLLALALLDELIDMGLVETAPTWSDEAVAIITARVKGGVDAAANAQALANVGRVLSWAGKQEEALSLVEQATEMTRDPHTLYQTVTVLMRNGRFEEALAFADEAARLSPDVATVRRIHGVVLSESGRPAEALRELEAAARLDPTMTDVHYHLGVVLSDLGRTDRAERQYRLAIEAEPGNADALNNLGILLAQRGDVAGAVDLFRRAVEAAPDHPDAARNLARARRMLGG